jgi:hypothetical protein
MGCCSTKKIVQKTVLEKKKVPIKKFSYTDIKNSEIYKRNTFIPIAEDRKC